MIIRPQHPGLNGSNIEVDRPQLEHGSAGIEIGNCQSGVNPQRHRKIPIATVLRGRSTPRIRVAQELIELAKSLRMALVKIRPGHVRIVAHHRPCIGVRPPNGVRNSDLYWGQRIQGGRNGRYPECRFTASRPGFRCRSEPDASHAKSHFSARSGLRSRSDPDASHAKSHFSILG